MDERELITIGFGNFSNLVASQWANGTSEFDVHHKTLYYERRKPAFSSLGFGNEQQNSGNTGSRALRLLLLDAPHVSYLIDVSDLDEEQEIEDAHAENQGIFSSTASPFRPSVLNTPHVHLTNEEEKLESVVRTMHKRWAQRRLPNRNDQDPKDLDEEASESYSRTSVDSDDESSDYEYRMESCGAGSVNFSRGPNLHQDPDGIRTESSSSAKEPPLKKHEFETRSSHPRSLRKLMGQLFCQKDPLVPWWQYIKTGIDPTNFITLHPLHSTSTVSEVPIMHNFGCGLAHFKSEISKDAEHFYDTMRHHLEEADRMQGLQCFVDGDSFFGGAAHNVLQELWDDAGSKIPVALFSIFTSLPNEVLGKREPKRSDGLNRSEKVANFTASFSNLRCEEVFLNRLLSTSVLSKHESALYVPIEVGNWSSLVSSFPGSNTEMGKTEGTSAHWWIDNDIATAQYLAAIIDTALYGTRDDGSVEFNNSDATGTGNSRGPAYYLSEWCQTLRPSACWRISALLGSLPLPINPTLSSQRRRDLWNFLESFPLLGNLAHDATPRTKGFVPLTHAMPRLPFSGAGRILGHTLTLRGAGILPSEVYPATEAMLRYGLPLGTSTYLPLLTRTNYPVSDTFPMQLLFDSKSDYVEAKAGFKLRSYSSLPMAVDLNPKRGPSPRFNSIDVGSHVVTTFSSGPMLHRIANDAKTLFRSKAEKCCTAYLMEEEEWKESIEDVLRIRDDYHHQHDEDADSE